jgi:hypothetical protein
MNFKKLFRLLVVGGAMSGVAAATGCAAEAASGPASKKAASDAGVAPDAGAQTKDTGSGAQGW